MRMARRYVLGFALFCGITLGASLALSGVDAPVGTAALSYIVDGAAAQRTADPTPTPTPTSGPPQHDSAHDTGGGRDCAPSRCNTTDNNHGGTGGGTANGDATLHDLITIGATSDTSMSLSDSPTGDINNVVIYNIEDTDETVVINNAGNPGSTGNHMMNVGGDPQAINTGGNNNIANSTNLADSVLCNGSFDGGGNASAGDPSSRTGADGFSDPFASANGGNSRTCNNNSENPNIRE